MRVRLTNVPETNELVVIDPGTAKIIARYPVPGEPGQYRYGDAATEDMREPHGKTVQMTLRVE